MSTTPPPPSEGSAVQVTVRVRGGHSEGSSSSARCVRTPDPASESTATTTLDFLGDRRDTFAFDEVFPESTTQETLHRRVTAGTIDEILNGFNATVLAYGQTASGKTHTMEGTSADPGVVPRLCRELFEGIAKLSERGEETVLVTVRASFVEIYCERLRDLLAPPTAASTGGQAAAKPLGIRQTSDGRIALENAVEVFATNEDQLLRALHRGKANRAVGATQMNADSSRSHSIFIVTVEQENPARGTRVVSKLVLVDLAGSESVKRTAASGERLDEAKAINKSLFELGNVINALVDKQPVPYRNSKLTRLLQDSLGGTAKTRLIVTLSPLAIDANETLSTLRFAKRAKNVRNRVTKNVTRSVDELERLLSLANARVEELLRGGGASAAFDVSHSNLNSTASAVNQEMKEQLEELKAEAELVTEELVSLRASLASTEKRALAAELQANEAASAHATSLLRESRMRTVDLPSLASEIETLKQENARLTALLVASSSGGGGEEREDDLPERLIELQVLVFSLQEQLASVASPEPGSKSKKTPLPTTRHVEHDVSSLGTGENSFQRVKRQNGVLQNQLDALTASHALTRALLRNRDDHTQALECMLSEFQQAFKQKIQEGLEREERVGEELATTKTRLTSALDSLKALASLAGRPSAGARAGGMIQPMVVQPTSKEGDAVLMDFLQRHGMSDDEARRAASAYREGHASGDSAADRLVERLRSELGAESTFDEDLREDSSARESLEETEVSPTSLVVYHAMDPRTDMTQLKMMPIRTFHYPRGATIAVRQEWSLAGGKGGSQLGFGNAVYPAGAALAQVLADRPELVREKRVIELGTGVGLVALAASSSGASEVLATDGDEVSLRIAERNVAENNASGKVRVAKLLWGEDVAGLAEEKFDVLIASDIAAYPYRSDFSKLIRTVRELGVDLFLLTYVDRHASEAVFWRELRRYFECEERSEWLEPSFRSVAKVQLMVCTRKSS